MRTSERSIIVDVSLFSTTQMHPHVLLRHQLQGISLWLYRHSIPFPDWIRKHDQGMVYLEISLAYHERASFFDFHVLDEITRLRSSRERKRVTCFTEYHGGGRHLASIRALYCILDIVEHTGSGARPGLLCEALQGSFLESEIDEEPPQRSIPELISEIESDREPLVEKSTPFQLHRGLAEFADQWLFCQIPHIYGPAREALVLQHSDAHPLLTHGLASPLRNVDILCARPLYAFDQGHTESRAYDIDGRLAFVHRLYSNQPGATPHAVIAERF